jgi:hypothetical protein
MNKAHANTLQKTTQTKSERMPIAPKLSEDELLECDAKRDLAAELKESLAQLKRGEISRVWVNGDTRNMQESTVARTRFAMKLS